MLPFDDADRKRRINLGGNTRISSASAILDSVKAQREQRLELKRRQDAAVKIQAWWRGRSQYVVTKNEMKRAFQNDILGITGLRCLVLMGLEDEALGLWARSLVNSGQEQVYMLGRGPYATSWLTLIRKAALLLLASVSRNPSASEPLHVLLTLLSPEAATTALGARGPEFTNIIASYLLNSNYYPLISEAIRRIPQKSAQIPLLLSLATAPLSIYPPTSPQFASALSLFLSSIFTIPQLPNRIPLDSLPTFVSHVPIAHLHAASPYIDDIIAQTNIEAKVHLVANSSMFLTPHYRRFPPDAMVFYLHLMASIFHALPPGIFDPSSHKRPKAAEPLDTAAAWTTKGDDDDDDEESAIQVVQVKEFTASSPPLPKIDSKTLARLQKVPTQAHIESLLSGMKNRQAVQDAFIVYVLALNAVWPQRREQILSMNLALTEGNLIRSLYRFEVRTAPLGKDGRSSAVFDPQNAKYWPPLLLLAELYAQALLTMGDDEFFASSASMGSSASAIRNPLSLDELVAFSRQLMNIAFTLYWTEDQIQKSGGVGAAGYSWEVVREKVTKCLVAIHARDSRKPFIPQDGWLVTSSQLDMRNFVQAAIMEEQQLASPDLAPGLKQRLHGPQSKRAIASLSPCLGILNNIPFSVPFEVRVSMFRNFVMNDMAVRGVRDRHSMMGFRSKERVRVRRGRVAQDGFDRLSGDDVDLKMPIEITFVDQFGQEEAGIDGGGVFKEFFTDLCKEVFDTDRGLWLANVNNELYPNPHSYATEPHSLNWYRFIGRILGKAMYEGILVDVAFAGFFLAKWLGKQSFLDDLASLDPDLYKGLIFLKHYKGNFEDLSLNFTIAVDELGVTKNVELVPDGSNISVTKENRLKYITLVSHYRLSRQIRKQSEAFFEGLSEMIDARWLRMFNQQEVQILIGGVNAPIDLDDLRERTNYGGLYDDKHPVIVAFWKVINEFDQDQRRALLRFVTSCSRPPLLGFKELVPNFSIRDAGTDSHRLPTSSTCVNLLKLPLYSNERVMREKILQAITSGAGFDLS